MTRWILIPRQEIRINRTLKKIFVYMETMRQGQAIGLAHLNIGLLGREVQIEAHVVDGPTPLSAFSEVSPGTSGECGFQFRQGLVSGWWRQATSA